MNARTSWIVLVVLFVCVSTVTAQDVLFSTEDRFDATDPRGLDGGAEDTYQVRVEEGTLIEVIVRSIDVDTYIAARFPDGGTVENDDYDGRNAGFLRQITTTGTMEIAVSPLFADEEGAYEIIVRQAGPFETISSGDRVNGELIAGLKGRRAARYQLTGRPGTSVVIDLISDDFDAYLQIVDSRGQEYSNDDGGGMFNSRLSYDFSEEETITVVATSLGGDETGRYELSVAERTITVEAEYRGVLAESDERAYDGTLYDVYEYEGSAGSTIGFAVESDDFDTVVYVANPDGTNLGRDDDGGGGTNSRLDVTLPENGTYRIYVVALYGTTGEYRLTIYR
ncbi:MAG: hypothetical protein PF508_19310 [Spirochaeta sp.]|jgi:hypothetical protein|nr:hypothetical protein [Spirochaeta sp.]